MVINDLKGMYTLTLDKGRRVVYEVNKGIWTKDDIARFQSDYEKIGKEFFDGKPWAAVCDLRDYKTSSIADEITEHTNWKVKNGLKYGAILVSSAIVKMQLNRTTGGIVTQQAFTEDKEADEWLKSQGY